MRERESEKRQINEGMRTIIKRAGEREGGAGLSFREGNKDSTLCSDLESVL